MSSEQPTGEIPNPPRLIDTYDPNTATHEQTRQLAREYLSDLDAAYLADRERLGPRELSSIEDWREWDEANPAAKTVVEQEYNQRLGIANTNNFRLWLAPKPPISDDPFSFFYNMDHPTHHNRPAVIALLKLRDTEPELFSEAAKLNEINSDNIRCSVAAVQQNDEKLHDIEVDGVISQWQLAKQIQIIISRLRNMGTTKEEITDLFS